MNIKPRVEAAAISGNVALIDSQGSHEHAFRQAFGSLGCGEIRCCRSTEELDTMLTSLRPEWLFFVESDPQLNGVMRWLEGSAATTGPAIPVSVLLPPGTLPDLTQAFRTGLSSWHRTSNSETELKAEFLDLRDSVQDLANHPPLVAARYWRKSLVENKRYEELLIFERLLIDQFPDELKLKLYLAEAQFLGAAFGEALLTLGKVRALDPALHARADDLAVKYQNKRQERTSFAERFQIRRAAIIDADPTSTLLVGKILKDMGVTEVLSFDNGTSAWDDLRQGPEPNLIILNWRLPGLSGPYLVQRLRQHGFISVPVIICVAELSRQDAQLIKDLYIAKVLQKPLRIKPLTMALAWVIKEYREPSTAKGIERKIAQSLATGDHATMKDLTERYFQLQEASPARRKFVEALAAIDGGQVNDAIKLLADSIRISEGDNVDATTLLAKCLSITGDKAAAASLMARASAFSPKNLEKLCDLVELLLVTHEESRAIEHMARAETHDPQNTKVMVTSAKAAVVTGGIKKALGLTAKLESLDDLMQFLNNRALTLIRAGSYKEGIAIYRQAIECLPLGERHFRAILQYNAGLAALRNGDDTGGMTAMRRVIKLGESSVFFKAKKILAIVLAAMKKGSQVRFGELGESSFSSARTPNQESSQSHSPSLPEAEGRPNLVAILKAQEQESLEGTPAIQSTG